MEVPQGDLEAIAALMRRHGKFCPEDMSEIDLGSFAQEAIDEVTAFPQFHKVFPDDSLYWDGLHREVVAFYLETAHEAIATWLAIQNPGGLEELVEPTVTEEALAQFNADNADIPGNVPEDLEVYRRICLDVRISDLEGAVDGALSNFSIGLRDLSFRRPTVYSVSFLQLYNHLVERAELRTCANETCGRSFTRQRGRAEYGQHRTSGIMYCSRNCARAQSQRQLRRRRRAEATGL